MSRVTAAFVCALCDPDNPRPASIMCSNNCGRYVCAVHAMPRKGPGSAMVCLACAEALGLIEKPQPASAGTPTPIVTVRAEPEIKPTPKPEIVAPTRLEEPSRPAAPMKPESADKPIEPAKTEPTLPPIKVAPPAETAPKPEVRPLIESAPAVEPAAAKREDARPAARLDSGATLVGTPPIKRPDASAATPVVPTDQQSQTARRLVEPPPPPQSSETIVSQRGNTLQVPKVSQTGPRPAQSTGARPRLAQRAEEMRSFDRQTLISLGLSAVGGIIGLVLLLIAVFGR